MYVKWQEVKGDFGTGNRLKLLIPFSFLCTFPGSLSSSIEGLQMQVGQNPWPRCSQRLIWLLSYSCAALVGLEDKGVLLWAFLGGESRAYRPFLYLWYMQLWLQPKQMATEYLEGTKQQMWMALVTGIYICNTSWNIKFDSCLISLNPTSLSLQLSLLPPL